jgi:hypothetical protein
MFCSSLAMLGSLTEAITIVTQASFMTFDVRLFAIATNVRLSVIATDGFVTKSLFSTLVDLVFLQDRLT